MPATIEDFAVTPWLTGHHRAADGTITPLTISGGVPVTMSANMRVLHLDARLMPGGTVRLEFDPTLADIIIGTTKTQSITTTNADATVTTSSTAFMRAGMTITGTGIPVGATIASITNSTTFELSANATASGTVTGTFSHAMAGGTSVPVSIGTGDSWGSLRLFAAQCYDENGAPVSVTVADTLSTNVVLPAEMSGCCVLPLQTTETVANGGALVLTANHTGGLATLVVTLAATATA